MTDWSPNAVVEWEGEPLNSDRPDWQELAKCRGTDPDVFFPADGFGVMIAQQICGECPVRQECLEFALANNEDHGIWGGVSERGRRKIRRRRAMGRRAG